MKQTITDINIDNKRVLLRCDFNVPIKNGNVIDNTKIVKSLETINYLITHNAKIIILSHLGRVKTEEDKRTNSLYIIKPILENLLNKKISFASDILSPDTKQMALNLQPGEILLLENTRFLDVPNKLESKLNEEIAQKIAELGEVYIFDAFAVAHRSHTSVVGIPRFLPNAIGFLVAKEVAMLNNLVINPEHPFTVLMGGAKVDDKLPIIESLLPICDHLLLSGGIANSFLNALGLSTGASLKTNDPEIINKLKELMLKYKTKFAFPLDATIERTYDEKPLIKATNNIEADDIIKDIGPKTITKYTNIINNSATIFVNGTMGVYEENEFKNGTIEIFNALKNAKKTTVIGGGDTISALNNLGFKDVFANISSGGGATLEYIAKKSLPGLDAISEEDTVEVLDL